MKKGLKVIFAGLLILSSATANCSIKTFVTTAKQVILDRAAQVKNAAKKVGNRSIAVVSNHKKTALGISVILVAAALVNRYCLYDGFWHNTINTARYSVGLKPNAVEPENRKSFFNNDEKSF